MTDDASDEAGKVGYKRPPVHTRFQKGQSGNPRGRQKGVRNFASDAKKVLELPVTLNDMGKSKRVSTQEALFMRMREKALKGDARALDRLLGIASTHNNCDPGDRSGEKDLSAEDQAIFEAFVEDVRSRPHGAGKTASDVSVKSAKQEIDGDE